MDSSSYTPKPRYIVRTSRTHIYGGGVFANESVKGSIGEITNDDPKKGYIGVQWVYHPEGSHLVPGNGSNIDRECVEYFPTFQSIQDVEHFLNTTPQREG